MGTHPIFESDFDCLTEMISNIGTYTPVTANSAADPMKRTMSPCTTGGSILAIAYDTGVIVAGDRLGAYGGLHRFRDIDRIVRLNSNVLLTYTGDVADFQTIQEYMEEIQRENDMTDDGSALGPVEYFNMIERMMYNRRSKNNPYWNTLVIAGFDVNTNKPFLGQVDSKGSSFQTHLVGTGFGGFLVHPLMERELEKIGATLNKAQAQQIMERALKVLHYRDKSTYNKWSIGTAEKDASSIEQSRELETNWEIAKLIVGYE